MKGIIFCVVLFFVSLNAMPPGLDDEFSIEGLRRMGGAALIGHKIAGGISGSISTSVGALAGLGLKAIEAIGGGIVGIGHKTSSGLLTGLKAVHHLRRSQERLEELENYMLRRKGGAAMLGAEIAGGIAGSISTSVGALAGLGLSIIKVIGGGIVGFGDKTGSGLITGLKAVHHLRRTPNGLGKGVYTLPWDYPDYPLIRYPRLKDTIMIDIDDMNLKNSGVGILGIGDIDTGDVGISGLGKVNDITVNNKDNYKYT